MVAVHAPACCRWTWSDAPNERRITMGVAKDKAKTAKGAVKEKVGKAAGDRSLQAEGKGEKASGNLKQAGRKVKKAL
jgi:uncharacterized protein YjbJ (UPF0337 family)